MRNPLANHVIAVTGDFGGGGRTHENMKRWVEANGGQWVTSITKETTHLVCSKEHWKKKLGLAKAAQKQPHIKVVNYDWLEDSLQAGSHKREGPYLWKKQEKKVKKAKIERKQAERPTFKKDGICSSYLQSFGADKPTKKADKRRRSTVRAFEKGCEKAKTDLMSGTFASASRSSLASPSSAVSNLARLRAGRRDNSGKPARPGTADSGTSELVDTHHIYRDPTGFDFDIILSRIDMVNNRNERYTLRVYESNAQPHCYATHIRFFRPSGPPIEHIQAPIGSSFEVAFREFCKVFRGKTRLHWDERFNRPPTTSNGIIQRGEMLAEGGDTKVVPFVYIPPEEGQPRGMMPEVKLKRENDD